MCQAKMRHLRAVVDGLMAHGFWRFSSMRRSDHVYVKHLSDRHVYVFFTGGPKEVIGHVMISDQGTHAFSLFASATELELAITYRSLCPMTGG